MGSGSASLRGRSRLPQIPSRRPRGLRILRNCRRGPLTAEELADALERAAERSAAGAVWQTLREQGDWDWMS